jgi:hypothetical protein
MFDTTEINRLQRCAKNKDKEAIKKWGLEFEDRIKAEYDKLYKKQYILWLEETFKDLDIAICYTLHFNENTKFGNKRLKDFMNDLAQIVRGFYNKEFSREEYRKELIEDGIKLEEEKNDNSKSR